MRVSIQAGDLLDTQGIDDVDLTLTDAYSARKAWVTVYDVPKWLFDQVQGTTHDDRRGKAVKFDVSKVDELEVTLELDGAAEYLAKHDTWWEGHDNPWAMLDFIEGELRRIRRLIDAGDFERAFKDLDDGDFPYALSGLKHMLHDPDEEAWGWEA